MLEFSLQQIAQATGGQVFGNAPSIHAVSTDSRKVQAGELFVALRGEHFDGHDYVRQAAARGVSAVMVSKPVDVAGGVLVGDTLKALGDLAQHWREVWDGPVVAVTGSNGKTSVKEMTAAILRGAGEVLATQGNLNNEIGLPLTLCRLQQQDYAVVEMGANHAGEIARLTRIGQPDVAVLNNAGRAHLEGFGSEDGVARAKLEIIQGLKPGGYFVFNQDDKYAPYWRSQAQGLKLLGFGTDPSADIYSPADSLTLVWKDQGFVSRFQVHSAIGEFNVETQLAGAHNRLNALAAIAATQALGIDKEIMIQGLAKVAPVSGRLCPVRAKAGCRLIDDSYNANPDSVRMAIQVLAAAPGRRTLVLGDLAELGVDTKALHAGLGKVAKEAGIDRLYACGVLSAEAVAAFGSGARHFATKQELASTLLEELGMEDAVLVKGSRSAGMDTLVDALREGGASC